MLGVLIDSENRDSIIGYRVLINSILVIDLEKEKLINRISAADSPKKLVNFELKNGELKVKNDIKVDKIIKCKN